MAALFKVELWGVVEGLQIAWRIGHRKIILEIHSMEVATMLSSSVKPDDYRLCKGAHKYMNKEWEMIYQHTYREGNKFADGLASMAWDQPLQCFVFYYPPNIIRSLLNADINGFVTSRLMVD
ncbi:hypothetical protein CXB51_018560 [Gossypium anomalum]|uniref:RNase H type-1 domain-containing protein n=1 Tax=Gossypium anomalum TaxID=47600 RepID=A0A8J6D1L8_9ROSI|nr:hypothetical protein CXB51_018560 [Gossypium anomalum]